MVRGAQAGRGTDRGDAAESAGGRIGVAAGVAGASSGGADERLVDIDTGGDDQSAGHAGGADDPGTKGGDAEFDGDRAEGGKRGRSEIGGAEERIATLGTKNTKISVVDAEALFLK